MGKIIGIDLGTTNRRVAIMEKWKTYSYSKPGGCKNHTFSSCFHKDRRETYR